MVSCCKVFNLDSDPLVQLMIITKFKQFFKTIRLVLLFFFLFQSKIFAQADQSYVVDKPSQLLYLTTDKTVYVPGEVVWFSTYFLDPENSAGGLSPDMLTVALMRQDTTGFSLSKNYLIQQGLCAGSMTLPDSLSPGDYTLVAVGDLLDNTGKPYYKFKTSIRIKSQDPSGLYVGFEMNMVDNSSDVLVHTKMSSADRALIADTKNRVYVHLSSGWKLDASLDLLGNATLRIPKSEIAKSNGLLYGRFAVKDRVKYSNFWLKNSIADTPDKPIDSEANTADRRAWIKTDAPVAGDTLYARVFSPQDSLVLLHTIDSYGNTVAKAELKVRTDRVNRVLVPLTSTGAGIHKVLLLSAQQDTLSSLPFYAHYGHGQRVTIHTDRSSYSLRDKVGLQLEIKDEKGLPINALVTLSCVYAGRIESDKKNNLPTYFYLNKLQGGRERWYDLSDTAALRVDLQQANARQNGIKKRGAITLHRPAWWGQVHLAKKTKEGNTYTLLYKKDTIVSIGETDSMGRFTPTTSDLLVTENRKLFVFPNYKGSSKTLNPTDYWVSVPNPMDTALRLIEKDIWGDRTSLPQRIGRMDTVFMVKGEPMNFIEEVAVFAKPNEVRKDYVRYGVNECGDYVCQHNYLNCGIHAVGRPAIKGQSYINFTTGLLERYKGCDLSVSSNRRPDEVYPIYRGKVFRGMSEIELNDKNNSMYLTTLQWLPYLTGDEKKNIATSFFTSDMEGKYMIRIEGITEKGKLFFAEKMIEVRDLK